MSGDEDLLVNAMKYYKSAFTRYDVEFTVRDRLLGAVPKDLDTYMILVEARHRKGYLPDEGLERIKERVRKRFEEGGLANIPSEEPGDNDIEEDTANKHWNTFFADGAGLYMEGRTWRAMIRDMMSAMGFFKKVIGTKTTHNMGLYIEPARIRLTRDGKNLHHPDGTMSMPVIIMDRLGQRAAIKTVDYVEKVDVALTIKTLKEARVPITDEMLWKVLGPCQDVGWGAARSQCFGQFDLTKLVKRAA